VSVSEQAPNVAGYSRMMGVDEVDTLAALKAYRRDLIDPKIAEHNGRIVKTTCDGMLIEFASVVDALACAMAVQGGMVARNARVPDSKQIVFRIGINIGDVIIDEADIHGDGVDVAVRLEGLAQIGSLRSEGHDKSVCRDWRRVWSIGTVTAELGTIDGTCVLSRSTALIAASIG
jgi:class 3 adenylate cyclase